MCVFVHGPHHVDEFVFRRKLRHKDEYLVNAPRHSIEVVSSVQVLNGSENFVLGQVLKYFKHVLLCRQAASDCVLIVWLHHFSNQLKVYILT